MNAELAGHRDHLNGRLEAIAARLPEKVAVVAESSTLTYAELLRRADSFAAPLRDAGVRSGDRVVVVLPNGAEFVVAAFGVWRLGAILTPLHTQLRPGEIVRCVLDCRARALVVGDAMDDTVGAVMEKCSDLVEHVWHWSKAEARWRCDWDKASIRVSTHTTPDDDGQQGADIPALTQFSTGSTGHPKRVTRTHRHLIGEVEAVSRVLGRTEVDRVLGVAPFFHSHGLMNAVLGSLLTGGTLYAVERFFPREVARLIEQENITGFPGSPFMFQSLAELPDRIAFPHLRWVVSAGAPLPPSLSATFRARFGAGIRELYGCTEAGVLTVASDADPVDEHTVGRPIPGVRIGVVDAQRRPVRLGEKGVIEVTSEHAAPRYDHADNWLEAHFVGRKFYPGDIGRLTLDGRVVLLGRDRGFINVAGNKVDPTEVESVLRELAEVTDAAVLGIPDGAAQEKVKAVLVVSTPCSREIVLAHCRRRLAPFKIPRVIEFRTELPTNLLGKVLRKYLLDEEGADPA